MLALDDSTIQTTHSTVNTESLAGRADTCAQCAAPLAHDQRYCLHCGARRAQLDGPFASGGPLLAGGPHAGGGTPVAGAGAAPGASVARPSPVSGPPSTAVLAPASAVHGGGATLLAGVAVLLLAMGVGVLIGRSGSGREAASPTPVISVAAPAAGASTPTTTPPPTPTGKGRRAGADQAGKGGSGATGNSIAKPAPPSAAQELRSKSAGGQSFEQKSKNLPNVISTG